MKNDSKFRGALLVALLLSGQALSAQYVNSDTAAAPHAAFVWVPSWLPYGDSITVTATAIPVERIPISLNGAWHFRALPGVTPGSSLSGDLGGFPAPEIANPSIDQYLAKTGWDIVAEDAAFRRCSENIDDNDRLGTDYGGPNTTRPWHTGVDIQANNGAPVYTWQGGTLGGLSNPKCGPNGVQVFHLDGSVTTYCHMSWARATSGWIASGSLIGRVGGLGSAEGRTHLHVSHQTRDGRRIEYFERTRTKPTRFTPRSQGGC